MFTRQWQYVCTTVVFLIVLFGSVVAGEVSTNFNVRDFGAVGDAKTLDTEAINTTILKCSQSGGGTVYFPAGTYLTGTLFFRDHVSLYLEAGAVILGSTDLKDYPERTPAFRSYTENYVNKSLIYAEKVKNIAILGRGIIDGQGGDQVFTGKSYKQRPYMIRMIECNNVTVRDITLCNSPMWVQHYLGCENVHINGITVESYCNKNNDGIDIDSCERVRIANCNISSGDDAIVLKSTTPKVCRQVTITNCVLSSGCNAFKCGTESTGGFQDITVSNCVIYDTKISGIALEMVDGGRLERVTVSNITMVNTPNPIFIRLGNRARPYLSGLKKPAVGQLRDVIISNIQATGADHIGCPILGLPDHPVENITLRDVRIHSAGGGDKELIERDVPEKERDYPEYKNFGTLPAYGFYCRHACNVVFENIQLSYEKAEYRPALFCEDVQSLRLTNFDGKAPVEGEPILLRNVQNVKR